jgi:hypothetical protein
MQRMWWNRYAEVKFVHIIDKKECGVDKFVNIKKRAE